MNNTNWSEHHEITKNDPPSELLVKALAYVRENGTVLDLGDGALKDARYLLGKGFDVTVVDSTIRPIEPTDAFLTDRAHLVRTAFDMFAFGHGAFDLVTAMFALPFSRPETFDGIFCSLKESLKKYGIFCGQLFGEHDDWKNNPGMTFHRRTQVERLFADMEVLSLVEIERDSKTADGSPKHWHLFHVIARK